jgi:hypothetical protein
MAMALAAGPVECADTVSLSRDSRLAVVCLSGHLSWGRRGHHVSTPLAAAKNTSSRPRLVNVLAPGIGKGMASSR